ncbi:MAG: hypothetical protein ACRCYU_10330, partial [Nocardioides sp.]
MNTTRTRVTPPDHLPRLEDSPRRPLLGVLALLGAAVLLLGVPIALALFVGNPLPAEAPSRQWLTAPVTPWLVIQAFAVVLWMVWAHFVVCFLTEWRALVRGALPGRVVTGGGSQLLARQLISGILLLSGGASLAHGMQALGQDEAGPSSAASVPAPSANHRPGPTTPTAPTATGAQRDRAEAPHRAAKLLTTVRPPQGRHHDTVWDIAQRTLGDPLRYREIYDLNRDRTMPDGRRFADVDLIHPGWQLYLPPDASGPDVEPVHDHHIDQSPRAAGASRRIGDPNQENHGAHQAPASATRINRYADSATPPTDLSAARPADSPLGSLLVGGGLILAGLVRAITARNGPFGAPDPLAEQLAGAAASGRADFLDQALRTLAEQCRNAGQSLPEVRFAYLNDERLVLHLAGVVPAPAAPWTVSENQRAWTLTKDAFDLHGTESMPATSAPYPSLVCVAARESFDVLVDLETAPGVIGLVGNSAVARDLATAMAVDLATHPWSDSVRVFMVGFGEHFVDAGSGRTHAADDLDEVLDRVGQDQSGQAEVLARLGVQGVLQGRQRGAVAACEPMVAFLSGPPSAAQIKRISDLTRSGRTSVSVICVGETPGARWRLSVDSAGHLDAPALGISGVARRLTLDAQRRLRGMVAAADLRRAAG